MAKKRSPIPKDVAARVMFMSDNTCCKCEERLAPVQIHHIDENPANNELNNLAVLCLTCHNETQIRGGFARQLTPDSVRLFRDAWVARVAKRRQDADRLFIERSAGGTRYGSLQSPLDDITIIPRSSLSDYIENMPDVLSTAYRKVRREWSGNTLDMMRAAYNVTEVVRQMWLQLANSFPYRHFSHLTPAEYLTQFMEMRYTWSRALAESHGPGTGGTIASILVARGVLEDMEASVVELRDAVVGLGESVADRQGWTRRWRTAKEDGLKTERRASSDRSASESNLADYAQIKELAQSPEIFDFVYQGETIKITVRYMGNTAQGTGYTLFKQRVGGAEFYFDIIHGHHLKVFAEDIDGDGAIEIIVLYHCGAHTMGMSIYSLRNLKDVPTLIDGGNLGSDWPEFSWDKRTDGPGSIITKKDRDWGGVPARDFKISRYIVENGACHPLFE